MNIRLIYFARLREDMGISGEMFELPPGVSDVKSLRAALGARGGTSALALGRAKAVLVSVNQERFAIPQIHIAELIHILPEQLQQRIEVVGDAQVLVLRGSLIPLVRLSDALGIERNYAEIAVRAPRSADSSLNIVVMNAGALQYGLIVDELHETLEIVVKPLGRHLKHLSEYAGATILGDGQVALILDAAGIAAKEALVSMATSQRAQVLSSQEAVHPAQQQAFLTFRNTPAEYCAAPLDLVQRVLQVENGQIEWVGGRRTLQHRGVSLPLVTLKDAANVSELQSEQEKAVVIFNVAGREVGLLAGMPVDVVESPALIDELTLRQRGVLGSVILDGHTTLLANIYELVEAVYPARGDRDEWVSGPVAQSGPMAQSELLAPDGDLPGAGVVLLAEDSDFFRGQIRRFLEEGGFSVLAAGDGQAALELLHQNLAQVCLVLTDVEMPRMDGLALTRAIRADPRTAALPVIALTSLAGEEDIARGKAAGVDDYQIKLDRARLLEGIRALLAQLAEPAQPA